MVEQSTDELILSYSPLSPFINLSVLVQSKESYQIVLILLINACSTWVVHRSQNKSSLF